MFQSVQTVVLARRFFLSDQDVECKVKNCLTLRISNVTTRIDRCDLIKAGGTSLNLRMFEKQVGFLCACI